MMFVMFFILFCLWIISWIFLIYAAFFQFKRERLLGFSLFYIILFPVLLRIYVFHSYSVRPLQNIWVSALVIFVLLIVMVFYIMKFLGKINQNKISTYFSKIYSNTLQNIFNFLISYFIIGKLINKIFLFLVKYINTRNKKLLFLSLTNFFPRIIFFYSLLWDINVNQELDYSLRFSLLLIIPLIINLSLNILYIYAQYNIEQVHRLVFFDLDPLTEEEEKIIKIDPKKEARVKMWLKEPCESPDIYQYFDILPKLLPIYGRFSVWAEETKELFDAIIIQILIAFLCIQILCQICSIIQQIY